MNIAACRALSRLLAIKYRPLEQAEAADAGFDGGEWSGPAYSRVYQEIELQTIDEVAQRFSMDMEDLAEDWDNYQWMEEGHYQDVLMKKAYFGTL